MKLFYRRMGEGKPLVLLHGLLGSSDNLLPIGKYFADNYEVFIPDIRNHGHSPHSDVMSLEALSNDILVFFDDHNISEAILMGHSMGGKIAMQFALNNMSRIEKLIVVDIGVKKYASDNLKHKQTILEMNFNAISSRKEVKIMLKEKVVDEGLVKLILKNIESKGHNLFGWRSNVEAIYANVPNILDAVVSDEVFNKPTLFIKGAYSDYITPEDLPAIKKNFPLMRIDTVPDAGHWVHVDDKGYFINAVERFMKE